MSQVEVKKQFKAKVCGQPDVVAVEAVSSRSFGRHTHEQFGIGVVISGAQDSASGRGQVRAINGNIITVNPNEVHDGRPVQGKARTWRMLYLDTGLVAQLAQSMGHSAGVEFIHPVLWNQSALTAFARLYAMLTESNPALHQDIAEQELFHILTPLLGSTQPNEAALLSKELAQAKARLDAHPEIPVSLEELATEAGLSRFQFLRAFKAVTHLPPHAYRLQRQLQLARRLILQGQPLLEAAYLAGFADQSHLTRHFVSSYGLTPGSLLHSRTRQPIKNLR